MYSDCRPYNEDASPFSNDCGDSRIEIIGKASSKDILLSRKRAIYSAFIESLKRKYPFDKDACVLDCDFETSEILSYKKIRCGNCVFSIPNNNLTDDSYIHLKSSGTPEHASYFYQNEGDMPVFAQCISIYSIRPFFRGTFLNNVYYFFLCKKGEQLDIIVHCGTSTKQKIL